jgi:hypothetical protein
MFFFFTFGRSVDVVGVRLRRLKRKRGVGDKGGRFGSSAPPTNSGTDHNARRQCLGEEARRG